MRCSCAHKKPMRPIQKGATHAMLMNVRLFFPFLEHLFLLLACRKMKLDSVPCQSTCGAQSFPTAASDSSVGNPACVSLLADTIFTSVEHCAEKCTNSPSMTS